VLSYGARNSSGGRYHLQVQLKETTYVLRKTPVTDTELDTKITNFFLDSKLKSKEIYRWNVARKMLLDHLDASKVEQYNFISECFANLPSHWKEFREMYWRRLMKSEKDFAPNIFALH
jgi:hypothetical protein